MTSRFFGYHYQQRFHAKKQVIKNVYTPEPALGVSYAEILEPYPFGYKQLVSRPKNALIPAANNQDNLNWEDTGTLFTIDDFPKEGFLGETLYPY